MQQRVMIKPWSLKPYGWGHILALALAYYVTLGTYLFLNFLICKMGLICLIYFKFLSICCNSIK